MVSEGILGKKVFFSFEACGKKDAGEDLRTWGEKKVGILRGGPKKKPICHIPVCDMSHLATWGERGKLGSLR